jgi:hypothetical protein
MTAFVKSLISVLSLPSVADLSEGLNMRVIIITEDSRVSVEGQSETVDLSTLDEDCSMVRLGWRSRIQIGSPIRRR